jgi:hypothetical protein
VNARTHTHARAHTHAHARRRILHRSAQTDLHAQTAQAEKLREEGNAERIEARPAPNAGHAESGPTREEQVRAYGAHHRVVNEEHGRHHARA